METSPPFWLDARRFGAQVPNTVGRFPAAELEEFR